MENTLNPVPLLTAVLRAEAQLQPQLQPIVIHAVCDDEAGQYVLLATGWENKKRVDWVLFHAQVRDGFIIIETDNLEDGLKPALLAAGVPADRIVFATAEQTERGIRHAAYSGLQVRAPGVV